MDEERRTLPFECRRCWHVWEEEYVVRHGADAHGHEREIWLLGGVQVPPPGEGAVCPRCGCQQCTTFPEGYLSRHPELIPPAEPAAPDATPLLSPVPRRIY
ncbi:hypothetical protein ACWGH8_08145 [Nonomuraea muscovyensis]|uniref:C2H2-type domain-containing protein n=1 Tax=Nonomuraea muscovyensis TaxID=1124761 RepID=A0A7X0C5V7_9ACTN|nr:hypothetical protein [Nonomuraea muscovyensis]MBB6349107.1 hypothetical protein [Nonomuraea muscovyensis]MDF2705961.1 hypothetical protein [Nonomuraea muscovyensis]